MSDIWLWVLTHPFKPAVPLKRNKNWHVVRGNIEICDKKSHVEGFYNSNMCKPPVKTCRNFHTVSPHITCAPGAQFTCFPATNGCDTKKNKSTNLLFLSGQQLQLESQQKPAIIIPLGLNDGTYITEDPRNEHYSY